MIKNHYRGSLRGGGCHRLQLALIALWMIGLVTFSRQAVDRVLVPDNGVASPSHRSQARGIRVQEQLSSELLITTQSCSHTEDIELQIPGLTIDLMQM